jgi:hypothetical protein
MLKRSDTLFTIITYNIYQTQETGEEEEVREEKHVISPHIGVAFGRKENAYNTRIRNRVSSHGK